jgi:flagellar biosynthesis/type III secretory pathway protein FliH
MNPSKRNVVCADCKERVDADDVVCSKCNDHSQDSAYDAGHEDGLIEGDKKGYDRGHDDGYTEGYSQGIEDASRKVEEALNKVRS